MSGKLSLVLISILGLFLAALVSRIPDLAWMALPFLGYLAAAWLTAPREVNLRAVRTIDQARCEAGAPVSVTVMVENLGEVIPCLRIIEPVQPKMNNADGLLGQAFRLPGGEKVSLHYTFQAPRGVYSWDTVQVVVSDPFGLFKKALELPAAAGVRILPAQITMKRLSLRPVQTIQTAGPNLSKKPGAGIDFYGVREYRPGDSLRWVHWRLSARHPSVFFTKEFEREEMADIGLILDGSAAANIHNGTESLFEYSVQAAASLSKSLLRMGNRVSFLALSEKVVRVFPGTGKHQLIQILDQLAGCTPGETVSLDTLKYLPVRLFPSHSLIILISPLRSRDVPVIARLRADGYQVVLISPNPVRFVEQGLHHPLAVRAAQLERAALLWRLREIGVQVIDWSVDQPLLEMAGALRWAKR